MNNPENLLILAFIISFVSAVGLLVENYLLKLRIHKIMSRIDEVNELIEEFREEYDKENLDNDSK
jgi:hypothetical protein